MNRRSLATTLLLTVGACQGSWAQQTKVDIAPIAHARVAGIAEVSQGKECDERGCRPHGSNVMVQLTAQQDSAVYSFILARGRCGSAPRTASLLARELGATFHTLGATAYVDIPIIPLTAGDYVIVVRKAKGAAVACGTIRRNGWI